MYIATHHVAVDYFNQTALTYWKHCSTKTALISFYSLSRNQNSIICNPTNVQSDQNTAVGLLSDNIIPNRDYSFCFSYNAGVSHKTRTKGYSNTSAGRSVMCYLRYYKDDPPDKVMKVMMIRRISCVINTHCLWSKTRP